MLLNLLQTQNLVTALLIFGIVFCVLVLCISVHEYAHAYAATLLGDPTPKSMGRLSLNPLVHLDPIGTLMLILLGFGWGRPVLFNPSHFKNPRTGAAIVSLAGPVSNFLSALLFSMIHKVLGVGLLGEVLYLLVYLNLVLCFFNLIPVNPLDGFKVVWGILPPQLAIQWMDLSRYGIYILLLLILTHVTDIFIGVPVNFLLRFLL